MPFSNWGAIMKKLSSLLLIAACMPIMAVAATDGVLGATSTGSVQLSLSTVDAATSGIIITGLEDITWTDIVLGERAEQTVTENICVYSDVADTYTIDISSQNLITYGASGDESGVLIADGDQNERLEYTWRFSDTSGNHVTSDVPNSVLISSGVENCDGVSNATFRIRSMLVPDTYRSNVTFTDTITLTVTPQ